MSSSEKEDCLSIEDMSNQNSNFDYSGARWLAIRDHPSHGGCSIERIKGALEIPKKKEKQPVSDICFIEL